MVEKGCGCACPSDFFGLHLIIIKPIGDPLGLGWASREARPVLMQSLS
jgi:hypothetical protein